MIFPPRLTLAAALAAAPLAATAQALPQCPVRNGQVVEYDIVRGGSVIGKQSVRYAVTGPDMTVTIDMQAALRAVGIRVYHYQHHGEERWRERPDGRARLTRTDDDGTPRTVHAARDPAGVWRGVTGLPPGPAPLLSTSLWNSQTVTQTRLLDRETGAGRAGPCASPAGDETLTLGGRQGPDAQIRPHRPRVRHRLVRPQRLLAAAPCSTPASTARWSRCGRGSEVPLGMT